MLINTYNPIQKINQDSNGIFSMFDNSRSDWVGIGRVNYYFGIDHSNIKFDSYMNVVSNIPTFNNGYRIPRNSLITSIIVQSKNLGTGIFEILKNSDSTALISITLNNEIGKTIDNLNINLNKDDFIQSFIKPNILNPINFPILVLEIAWR